MTHHTLGLFVGWVAVVPATAMTVAQLRRLRHTSAGVSTLTWAFLLCFNAWISLYGVLLVSAPLIITGLSSLVLQAWVLSRCPRANLLRAVGLSASITLGAVSVPALIWGLPGAVTGAMTVALALRAPQIHHLLTTRNATGVSVATWLVAALNNLLWAGYGVIVGQTSFAIFQGAMMAASLVVVALARRSQRDAARSTMAFSVAAA